MPKKSQTVALVLSLNVAGMDTATQQDMPAVVKGLAQWIENHDVSATWGFDSPSETPLLVAVRAMQPRQEIALVARGGWAAADASRVLFDAELSRRMLAANGAGTRPSTLLVEGGATPTHLDLVEKQGISALCRMALHESHSATTPASLWRSGWFSPSSARAGAAPQCLKWGLWQLPAAIDLARLGGWRTRQSILRRVSTEGFVHLCVDMASLVAGGARAERQLDAVLRLAIAGQEQGNLRLQSVAETVAQLGTTRQRTSARSILRGAA
ncbi:MAG TPA: hypothetical protein VGJ26_11860 [Pirellulales bacterium]|jgi:hypothetical protein